MMERLLEYKNKCKLLKQIQSDRALFYKKVNNFQIFMTVCVSALITFIGFSGVDQINKYIMMIFGFDVNIDNIQLVYNLMVFILFLLVILYLVFQANSKQSESEKAVTLLSSLINEIDDLFENQQVSLNDTVLDTIRNKYNMITHIIPANTDGQYLKAKKRIIAKENEKKEIEKHNVLILNDKEQEAYIIRLIEKNKSVQKILELLREQKEDLYLGGGIIRNIVWDNLHNYTVMTPIDDVDVIYFNPLSCTKECDVVIEQNLHKAMPNFKWSVKNQARMHTINNDLPYTSIDDAISKWPETVSAILLKKDNNGGYRFVAPFKFDDLFRLIVRPTPHFETKLEKYKARISSKKWAEKWGKLKFFYAE